MPDPFNPPINPFPSPGMKCRGPHPQEIPMTDEQIKHMVDRFLGWRLPENFSPDAGITFNPEYNVEFNAARGKPPARHQPSGTNLFGADQAEAMVRYMIEGLPLSISETQQILGAETPICGMTVTEMVDRLSNTSSKANPGTKP